MTQFTYRIFYEWKGKTKADPLARAKTQTEIERACREFPLELRHRLSDPEASISTTAVNAGANEVSLNVITLYSEDQVNAALTTTLTN